jgi:predicted phosphoadenosine phosphosulfate sulfurtransferase
MGGKTYLSNNVYDAAIERLNLVFDEFERVCVSFSGGKDSSVLFQLAYEIAQKRGRELGVLFIDLEGQYKVTIDHVEEIVCLPDLEVYWVCLPINLRNAVSAFDPHWYSWDPKQHDLWVRDLPPHDCVVSDVDYFPFYWYGMEFEELTPRFAHWFARGQSCASLVGIRSDESLNRFRTIVRERASRYKGHGYSTRISDPDKKSGNEMVYNFYPIYDWRVEDVWSYVGKHEHPYNKLYDYMYLAGESIHRMRICQPYGDDQRMGLNQFHKIEPDTWFRIVQRVAGANYGARYKGGKILGYHRGLGLPPGHTWESYTRLLLDTLPIKSREHFKAKFAVFLHWWEEHPEDCPWWLENGYPIIPDEAPRHLEAKKKAPSWRRLAMCILKNDFWCKSISFAMTKRIRKTHYAQVEETGQTTVKKSVKDKYRDL